MFNNLRKFEFIFVACMMKEFTADLINVASNLQSTSVDLFSCYNRIRHTIERVQKAQTDRRVFDTVYSNAYFSKLTAPCTKQFLFYVTFISEAIEIGLIRADADIRSSIPHDSLHETPSAYYFETVYRPYLQEFEQHLNNRFNSHTQKTFRLQRLVPTYFGM